MIAMNTAEGRAAPGVVSRATRAKRIPMQGAGKVGVAGAPRARSRPTHQVAAKAQDDGEESDNRVAKTAAAAAAAAALALTSVAAVSPALAAGATRNVANEMKVMILQRGGAMPDVSADYSPSAKVVEAEAKRRGVGETAELRRALSERTTQIEQLQAELKKKDVDCDDPKVAAAAAKPKAMPLPRAVDRAPPTPTTVAAPRTSAAPPTVSVPAVTVPKINLPQFSAPAVSLPSVAAPTVAFTGPTGTDSLVQGLGAVSVGGTLGLLALTKRQGDLTDQIEGLKVDIEEVEARAIRERKRVETEAKTKIDNMSKQMSEERARLESKLQETRVDLLNRGKEIHRQELGRLKAEATVEELQNHIAVEERKSEQTRKELRAAIEETERLHAKATRTEAKLQEARMDMLARGKVLHREQTARYAAEAELDKLRTESTVTQERLSKAMADVERLTKKSTNAETKLQEARMQLISRGKELHREQIARINAEEERDILRQENTINKERLDIATKENERLQKRATRAESSLQKARVDMIERGKEFQRIFKGKYDADEAVSTLTKQIAAAQKKYEITERELRAACEEADQLLVRATSAEAKLQEARRDLINRGKEVYLEMKQKLDAQETVRKLTLEVASLEESSAFTREELRAARAEIENMRAAAKVANAKLYEARFSMISLNKENYILNKAKESAENTVRIMEADLFEAERDNLITNEKLDVARDELKRLRNAARAASRALVEAEIAKI
ncbi:unnamed protein product [Pedinophyceae sp. YPF-701]|nr:unnamed protein product [Pedinophyceae sp. YPF-701]